MGMNRAVRLPVAIGLIMRSGLVVAAHMSVRVMVLLCQNPFAYSLSSLAHFASNVSRVFSRTFIVISINSGIVEM